MRVLLGISRVIDALNERVGQLVVWLVLLVTLLSAANALMRYIFHYSSNAYLEAQWYLFSLIFLWGAGWTLKHGGHVRVDVLYARLSHKAQLWIDFLGTLVFLLPMVALILWLSWPIVTESVHIREMSPDAGGLPRWPIKVAMVIGFVLLGLQGISELIKRGLALAGKLQLEEEKPEEVV
ncbi:TRAP transporter small permease subunit [Thermus sp. PS18]|uniref:TRAP transporter small permease subunit n=1 Tax=Thermus brevis TaxID=2862456 RepID=A0ABS7A0E8_9DEIN|nr:MULTISPECIES: TRAP transporter small permease subunit [Thermus]MBW6395781.1 TRAP transporter small permease subunit [Thermus brevis]UZX16074.1 TRAP transporter small permease subunit [Thermus sp. PS18]